MASASSVAAHQSPFTYLDIRVRPEGLELSLIAHAFDIAHDIGVEKPEQLFEEATLRDRVPRMATLFADRITFRIDGRAASADAWTIAEPLAQQQSIRFTSRVPTTASAGVVQLTARLFPYDPVHQTFVSFQEHDIVASQTILDLVSREAQFYAGSASGVWAAVRLLATRGFLHIAAGPEHLVMLVGLLLIGGSPRKQLAIAVAFVVGHIVTLTIGTYSLIGPPARLIDPAVALAIVYVGTDNLMSSGGRDVRTWLSFAIGAIHGFGFVAVLRAMPFSRPALAWSLVAANVGMVVAQLLVASLIGFILGRLRLSGTPAARGGLAAPAGSVRGLALVGSVGVIAAGAVWFVQRVFFPGAGV